MKSLQWVTFGVVVLGLSTISSICLGASVLEVIEGGRRLQVSVSDSKWKAGHVVCVVRDSKRVACGLIAELKAGRALVSVDFRNSPPLVGDIVVSGQEARNFENAKNKSAPFVPIQPSDHIHLRSSGRYTTMVSAVGSWDIDQISTSLAVETFISPRVTYGLQFSKYDLVNKQPAVDGYGFSVNRTFRATRNFAGIFASLGVGMHYLKLGNPATLNRLSVTLHGHVGWGAQLTSWLTGNAFVGVSYFTRPKRDGIDIGIFHTLRPSFGLTLGVPF